MKSLLCSLVAIMLLSAGSPASAQLYQALSSTPNRILAPTTFGLQVLTNANAAELLALISAAPSSNAVTLTGSQTIAGAKSLTNEANVFVGGSLQVTNLHATNLVLNAGAVVTGILSATDTLDFDLSLVDVEDLTITVTGAADGDVVLIGVPAGSVTATAQFTAWVSAADTVTVRCRVAPAAAEDPASGVFRATVIKH